MSNQARAIVIGMLGPGISLFGLAWAVLDALFDSTPESANFRYFLFDSPHLMIAVGAIVSAVCVPIAVQVAMASPEEVDLPDFEAEFVEVEAEKAEEASAAERQDGPYRWFPE